MKLHPLYHIHKKQLSKQLHEQCMKGVPAAQRFVFEQFYSDGMNVALRYSSKSEDAKEILSNAFLRAFQKIDQYDRRREFFPWLKRLIIHASSDFYRYKHHEIVPIEQIPETVVDAEILSNLSYQEILEYIQQLPHHHRIVFNLHIIEGYKHHEIAKTLDIGEGTSKSYLHRARLRLQEIIRRNSKLDHIEQIRREHKEKTGRSS